MAIKFRFSAATIFVSLFIFALGIIYVSKIFADPGVIILPGSGTSAVSIDTTSPSGTGVYTGFSGLTIAEGSPGDISAGVHTLTLPSGWEFNPQADGVLITITAGDIAISALTVTPVDNTLSFTVDTPSSATPSTIDFSGIWVRPTTTTPSSGILTHSGATITGVVDGTTSFGAVTSVVGALAMIDYDTLPSSTTVVNRAFSTQPIVSSLDQFGNLRSGETSTITLSAFSDIGCSTPALGTLGGTLVETQVGGLADFAGNSVQYDTISSIYLQASDGTNLVCSGELSIIADPDVAAVAADKANLLAADIKGTNIDLDNITVGLTNPLPSIGSSGSTITWSSNDTAVVSNDGQTINRPVFGIGNTTIIFTATLSKGVVVDSKSFSLTILEAEAVPTSTPTPTTTPTSAPNNNSQNDDRSAQGSNEAPQCHDTSPLGTPDLFKISTSPGSAKLIFTPVVEKISGYQVIYGFKKGDERFGAQFNFINNNHGEQSFTVNKLNPKTTYYFKVSAVNGCTSGPWSDWIPAKPDRKKEISKYKTVVKNKIKTLVNQFK